MLQILRDKAQSIVIQAIVVIIALVFIFWGVGTNMMNKQEAAIVVNDEELSFQQFQQAYDQAYERIAQQFGGTIPKGLAESLNIREQVLNQLTQQALLRQGAREMGLDVSGVEIQQEIESMIQFQENGAFDIERYKTILASNRLSPSKFEKSMRVDLLSAKTIDSLSSFAQPATEYEIADLYNLEKETVSVAYTMITPDRFLDEIELNDDALETWYQTAGENYKSEPMIRLTYLPFSYSDISKKVTLEDGAIQDYYDQHLTEYQIPEKRHARHILLLASPEDSDQTHEEKRLKAEDILEKAHNGEDFATLATLYSEGPSGPTGGDLGFFPQGSMVPPFDEAVFSMQQGEISEIVKTDFGYHIIKLEEIERGRIRTPEEVKDEITDSLKLEQAKPLAFGVANDAYEKIIGAGSLGTYLEKYPDTKIIETPFFSRSAPPAGMTADQTFLERAFVLKVGELSSIVETAEGYAIISATALKAPEVPELDSIKETVVTDYKNEQAEEKAKTVAEQLITDLGTGSTFEELAQAAALEIKLSGPLTKGESPQDSSFPPSLNQSIFRLSSSAPVPMEPGLVGRDYYVYQFLERKPPEAPMTEEDRERYSEMLLQFKQQQVVDAWLNGQQEEAEIYIHKSLQN